MISHLYIESGNWLLRHVLQGYWYLLFMYHKFHIYVHIFMPLFILFHDFVFVMIMMMIPLDKLLISVSSVFFLSIPDFSLQMKYNQDVLYFLWCHCHENIKIFMFMHISSRVGGIRNIHKTHSSNSPFHNYFPSCGEQPEQRILADKQNNQLPVV